MAVSGRMLVQMFAAHIVHLLDQGEQVVVISPLRLRQILIGTLSNDTYCKGLVAYPLMSMPSGPEAAAQDYLSGVLDRRLQLARDLPRHKAHELFEAMCRRGAATGWASALVDRASFVASREDIPAPEDFSSVVHRMKQIDPVISPGNPAQATSQRLGPLLLVAGAERVEVAEELTVWQSVTVGPLTLKKLAGKAGHNQLCSQMIKALETANAHWAALVSLGLWPPDWVEAVSVNTAKKAAAFVAEVRRRSSGFDGSLEHWQAAWLDHTVPGFKSAEAFWGSRPGEAIRRPPASHVEFDADQIADERDWEAERLEASEYSARLALAREQGVIDEAEHWFLSELQDGARVADLVASGAFAARVPESDPEHFAVQLCSKLNAFAKRLEE